MKNDKNGLIEALSKLTNEHWNSKKEPLLLSEVPKLLELEYKEIDRSGVLGDKSLKSFSKESEGANSFRVIEHPVQKAKVGLVPYDIEFKFPELPLPTEPLVSKRPEAMSREKIVLKFLKLLSTLPAAELDKIDMPVSVLVKLMK